MITNTKKVLLSTGAALLFSVTFAFPAYAAEKTAQALIKTTPAAAQIHLTNGPLQSCLARETAIQTRSASLLRLVNTMFDKFTSISTRVQDYYAKSGKTVARYSVLVGEVETNKNLVSVALKAAQDDVAEFNCTANDPKGHMTKFLKDMKAVKSALKVYRTSIKNLIVAVRSVTAEEVKASESPKPSPSVSSTEKTPNPRSNSQGRGNNQ